MHRSVDKGRVRTDIDTDGERVAMIELGDEKGTSYTLMPKDKRGPRLVKYLLNNRRHSTYWNSTRDTALCIEAMADYLKATGEDNPDMRVEVWLDGKLVTTVHLRQADFRARQTVFSKHFAKAGTHTIRIEVVTNRRPVAIDDLVVRH